MGRNVLKSGQSNDADTYATYKVYKIVEVPLNRVLGYDEWEIDDQRCPPDEDDSLNSSDDESTAWAHTNNMRLQNIRRRRPHSRSDGRSPRMIGRRLVYA